MLLVYNELSWRLHTCADLFRLVSKHNDHLLTGSSKVVNEAIQKRLSFKRKQRLGRAHTPGSAACQNDAGYIHERRARNLSFT